MCVIISGHIQKFFLTYFTIAADVQKITLPVSNKVNSLSGLLNPEDRGTTLIQNSGTHLI
jgi:hypothetical protein